MGAHVSVCPNHTVGRVTPFETRGHVALAGTFGYELDITKLSEEEQREVTNQVALYHRFQDLIRSGDYYRLASYRENHQYDCWEVASEDGREALVTFVQVMGRPNNHHSRRIKLMGLCPEAEYLVEASQQIYGGDALMYAGLPVEDLWGDFRSKLIYLRRVDR